MNSITEIKSTVDKSRCILNESIGNLSKSLSKSNSDASVKTYPSMAISYAISDYKNLLTKGRNNQSLNEGGLL